MLIRMILMLMLAFALPAQAQQGAESEDEYGALNPDDTGRGMLLRKIRMGARDSVTCSLAFNSTKYDDHKNARYIARVCAESGSVKAMIWMSYVEANGIGAPIDLEAASMWNRRAAEAGDAVGQYNYGLDLLRGIGTAQNRELGRHYIDQAAKAGLSAAQDLAKAQYDLSVVTPDAEE